MFLECYATYRSNSLLFELMQIDCTMIICIILDLFIIYLQPILLDFGTVQVNQSLNTSNLKSLCNFPGMQKSSQDGVQIHISPRVQRKNNNFST